MRTNYAVSGLTCGACVEKVTARLGAYPGIETLTISLSHGRLNVVADTAPAIDALNALLRDTRYRVSPWTLTFLLQHSLRRAKRFVPLITMFVLVLSVASLLTLLGGEGLHVWMMNLMGVFFLAFGTLKVINLRTFARSYRAYDHLARFVPAWGYVYPFVELVLGILFLMQVGVFAISGITFLLMTQKAYSVASSLVVGKQPTCACLGGFFSIPITWVTVAEDTVMGLMGLGMVLAYVI